jgi:UPF0271 protein
MNTDPSPRFVHLNCDTGEAPPGPLREQEHALLEQVTAVSIACGGHAGDDDSMREMVAAAARAGRLIGAHPSYPDRAGFGRRPLVIEEGALMNSVRAQIAALRRVCEETGLRVDFIKPHGALYHAIARTPALAERFAREARAEAPGAALVAPTGSPALERWIAMHIAALAEGFIDRVYEPDASLRDRAAPDALILDPARAADQALRLALGTGVVAHNGSILPIRARLLCVHADTPNGVEIAAASRRALEAAGVRVGVAP